MKNDTRTLTTLGFFAVAALMFSMMFVSLVQLRSSNERLSEQVRTSNARVHAAHAMQDAVHRQGDALHRMQMTQDTAARNEYNQDVHHYLSLYRAARDMLLESGIGDHQQSIHASISQATNTNQEQSIRAAELLSSAQPGDDIAGVVDAAEQSRERLLELLDRLAGIELEHGQAQLEESRGNYTRTRQVLLILSGIVLLFGLYTLWLVKKRTETAASASVSLAPHDPLTGLINRSEFERRLKRAIRHAHEQSITHAMLYTDIDGLKAINNEFGSAAGDTLLQQLAQILLGSVRMRDTLCRAGDDEFAVLLENCPMEKAVMIAHEVHATIEAFKFNWEKNSLSPAINISVLPIDQYSAKPESIFAAADSACYLARESGQNKVQIAHLGNKQQHKQLCQMQWVPRLSRALKDNRFALYFQPIIPCNTGTRQEKHIEILLRMLDNSGTLIPSRAFMPAAEKYDLVTDIDRWVIEKAMNWLAGEIRQGNCPVTLFINLSERSLCDEATLKFIIAQFDKTGVPPEHICFETTESAVMANVTAATIFMLSLRSHGCKFSLDEFCSGLSSIAYLKKLPFDYLKIDGTLIRDIVSDPVDHALVKSINEIGHMLGKETIAASVETMSVADELKKIGIDYVQGYAYVQPQAIERYSHSKRPRLVLVSS